MLGFWLGIQFLLHHIIQVVDFGKKVLVRLLDHIHLKVVQLLNGLRQFFLQLINFLSQLFLRKVIMLLGQGFVTTPQFRQLIRKFSHQRFVKLGNLFEQVVKFLVISLEVGQDFLGGFQIALGRQVSKFSIAVF